MANPNVIGSDDIGPIFADDDDRPSTPPRAFPSGDGAFGGGPNHDYGMTLRDYFAGQAMVAIITPQLLTKTENDLLLAHVCYQMADAMLAERKR